MAVTIVRTAWIDDDGTGTTGTVINNAVKTELYGQIDGALALVPQLSGGNTFTGDQRINGRVGVNIAPFGTGGSCQLSTFCNNASALGGLGVQCTDPVNAGNLAVWTNSAFGVAGAIAMASATTVVYVTSSDARLKIDRGRAIDLSALRSVIVHDFTWMADGISDRGIFAQEAISLFPRAVWRGTDERLADGSLAHPWMTDYSRFVADLIAGWQEHDAAIGALQAELAAVRAAIG